MGGYAGRWRATESGRLRSYAWRRADRRGWFLVPVGWVVVGLALWLSNGDPPSLSAEVRVAIGFLGFAVLIIGGVRISGSHKAWPGVLTVPGLVAVLIGAVDSEMWAARIACVVIALLVPGVAFLSGRMHEGRLPYLYSDPRIVQPSERPVPDYGSWSVFPASGLDDASVVLFDRWGKQTAFELTDAEGGVIARVREIPHPRGDDGMRAAFDYRNVAAPRYVIEVTAPDGRPLFFIDGSEIQTDASVPNGAGFHRSFAVVRPDGREIARCGGLFFERVYGDVMRSVGFRLDEDLYERGQSMFVATENGAAPCSWAIKRSDTRWQKRPYYTLLDPDGAVFAQQDYGAALKVRRMVRFRERTPVNLRMIGIASLVIFGSERRTEVLPPDPAAPEPYPGFGDTHQAHYRRLRAFMDKVLAERQEQRTW